ncbi:MULTISPECIES: hypothetical protein [Salinibaculum]|uniref:hypothetical protein n=1 Tax=Salinibaculum TaxID=2732368 RepID=UPI0030D55E5D
MAGDSPLLVAAVVLGVGLAMRRLELASLAVGVTTPVADPELTAEFVGDFLSVTALLLGALGVVNRAVALPDVVWLAYGLVIVVGVIATPVLAGWYVERRIQQAENV